MRSKNGSILICFMFALSAYSVIAADKISQSFSVRSGESGWSEPSDLNGDGIIDGDDLSLRNLSGQTLMGKMSNHAYRAERILVKFISLSSMDEARPQLLQLGIQSDRIKTLKNMDYSEIPVPPEMTAEDFLQLMKTLPIVKDAQYDYICSMTKSSNDPYFNLQWNFQHVGAERAWDLTSGGSDSVIIAVLDTGIAYEDYNAFEIAPDLKGTSFKSGYDFINDDQHANDDEGHGTHVAGTIAQTTNNNVGTAGLAYRCSLMPVKVLDSKGNGTSSSLAQGLRWAADKGADVINMSLGFPVGSDGGPVVRDAIEYAYSKGVIMVAASGNEANNQGYNGGIDYPAAFDECIGVGATRYDKKYTDYSNFGSKITCVAPGGAVGLDQDHDGNPDGILQQTFVNGDPTKFRYVFYQGTSMATPHVAAAAALFVFRRGGGPAEFLQAIRDSSEDLGSSGFDEHYGYGLINIPKIVRMGQGWGAN